jgi:predicted TPR repeat methyltransferase
MNTESQPMQILEAAVRAHQSGQVQQAEILYAQLLQADPDDADALHFFGLLRFQQGRSAEAETLMRKSLAAAPTNAHAWNNLGNVLFASDRSADAADAYLRAVDLDLELAAPWKNLAECLERAGSPERAIELFRHIIETLPGFVPAYDALGRVLRYFGRQQEAIEIYERWVALEPERATARHMLAAVTRENVPARAPDAYVKELFDGFAADFDAKLEKLDYKAPQLVTTALQRYISSRGPLRILDAGCGTGLCGALLRPFASELVGIDLSAGMLRKAQLRGTYDALHQAELTEYMSSAHGKFDVIVCVDTLCYFGALATVFAAARTALVPHGVFAFSVEQALGSTTLEFEIQSHGRFQHARSYLERTLSQSGFSRLTLEEAVLRREVRIEVAGLVAVATPGRVGGSDSCVE